MSSRAVRRIRDPAKLVLYCELPTLPCRKRSAMLPRLGSDLRPCGDAVSSRRPGPDSPQAETDDGRARARLSCRRRGRRSSAKAVRELAAEHAAPERRSAEDHDGRVEVLFGDGSALHLDSRTTIDMQSDELVRLIDGRLRLNMAGPARTIAYPDRFPCGIGAHHAARRIPRRRCCTARRRSSSSSRSSAAPARSSPTRARPRCAPASAPTPAPG